MKILKVFGLWAIIGFSYIILAVAMPAGRELISEAATTINASCNISQVIGVSEAVGAAPVYLWFIPGGIGLISTVWILKKDNPQHRY